MTALPWQVFPSPVQPFLQLHTWEPCVFLHVACLLQLWLPVKHSSDSRDNRVKFRWKIVVRFIRKKSTCTVNCTQYFPNILYWSVGIRIKALWYTPTCNAPWSPLYIAWLGKKRITGVRLIMYWCHCHISSSLCSLHHIFIEVWLSIMTYRGVALQDDSHVCIIIIAISCTYPHRSWSLAVQTHLCIGSCKILPCSRTLMKSCYICWYRHIHCGL